MRRTVTILPVIGCEDSEDFSLMRERELLCQDPGSWILKPETPMHVRTLHLQIGHITVQID